MNDIKRNHAEQKNNHGKMLCELGQYGNAKIFFTEAIELNPNEAKYWNNRSACNLTMGFYVQALYDSRKSITIDPNYINGYKRFAKCSKLLDDLESAKSALEKATIIDPTDTGLQSELKIIQELIHIDVIVKNDLEMKNYQELLDNIDGYLSVVPNSKKYIILKVECLVRLQKFSDANQVLAPLDHVEDEDFLYIKGLCNFYDGYITKTFNSLKEIKLRIPDHNKLSDLYKKAKKVLHYLNLIDDAISNDNKIDAYVWYGEALDIDPDNIITNKILFYNKVNIGLKCPDLIDKVILDCANYLQKYKDVKVLKIRAKCYMETKEYEDAIEDYAEILKIEENDENKKLFEKASNCFNEQCNSNYKILNIDEHETNERKVQKAYDELLLKYNADNERNQTKIVRIHEAFSKIIQELRSKYYSEYPVREKVSQMQTIQEARKLIHRYEFIQANDILEKLIKHNPNDEEAIYTQALCIFYGGDIIKTFEKLRELKQKISKHKKMAELYSKAEKTFEIVNQIEKSCQNNQEKQAYNLINEALSIDPENITTNKSLHLKKIQITSNDPVLNKNTYDLCSNYLNEFGVELAILKTRAKYSFEAAEYQDAMDDYEEILKMERNEENERLYKEASRLYKEENESDAKILRIEEDEDNAEKIKAAYFSLILLYHTDRHPKASAERKKKLERKLIRIRRAYKNMENKYMNK